VATVDCALPLDCNDVYGALTIRGWSLHTGAWCAYDLSPVFSSPAFRGENIKVESYPGRQPLVLVDDESEISLQMMFSGAEDRLGVASAASNAGLMTNLRAFREHIIDEVRNGAVATVASTLVVPEDGGDVTYAADVQPITLDWTLLPGGYARAVLGLRVPGGRWVEV